MSHLTIVQKCLRSDKSSFLFLFCFQNRKKQKKIFQKMKTSSIQFLLLLLLLVILGSTSGSSVFRMRGRLQQDDQEDLQVNP